MSKTLAIVKQASTLDDDRRDIAVMADVDAKMLNRMAKRNHGRNPLEISGDAIAVFMKQEKNQ